MERESEHDKWVRELGPDYCLKPPPMLIEYDTERLQRRAKNEKFFSRLEKLYAPVPEVTCGDCGDLCCRASPDFYLLEYLRAWRHIRYELDPAREAEIVHHAVRWALLCFIKEDVFCPFLFDGRCAIYDVRPFNCRVWALEDEAFYKKKASRAREAAQKQEDFFRRNGIAIAKPFAEMILPKCRSIKVHGAAEPLSENMIDGFDNEIALLHRGLIRPEEFRSLNFLLHFPGHIVLKRLAPLAFDETKLVVARELQEKGTETFLDAFAAGYGGRLP
jgi:Fe-S-cluster containining protein